MTVRGARGRPGRRGVRAHARATRASTVTLVDRNDYHQFQPLLYQVATSQLPAEDIARPHRTIFREYPTVEVVEPPRSTRPRSRPHAAPPWPTAASSPGPTWSSRPEAGPSTSAYPGAAEHAFPLYSVADAERLRLHLQELVEAAGDDTQALDESLDVVVVGGGPTGVETAGALAELTRALAALGEIPRPGTIVTRRPRHGAARRILRQVPRLRPQEADQARRRDPARDRRRRPCTPTGSSSTTARRSPTRTVVWGGGESAALLAGMGGLPTGRGGRIDVQPDLTVEGFPGVYAVGDVANIPGSDGTTLPQLGSVAQQAGVWAAANILRERRGDETDAVPLQGQGDHGDDRPQRGCRRGRQAAARGRGPDRVRRVAGCAREPAQRCPQQDRRVPQLGLGLLRPRPRCHRRGRVDPEAHRLGRPRVRRTAHLPRRPAGRRAPSIRTSEKGPPS